RIVYHIKGASNGCHDKHQKGKQNYIYQSFHAAKVQKGVRTTKFFPYSFTERLPRAETGSLRAVFSAFPALQTDAGPTQQPFFRVSAKGWRKKREITLLSQIFFVILYPKLNYNGLWKKQ
ncbi:MAG: hypothetical protein K5764_01725, partial [Prevotella sp.]|nr:hypothetical protein [Prevotella sp.]